MRNPAPHVSVPNIAFSRNPNLRGELDRVFPNVVYNDSGQRLEGQGLIEFLSGADAAIVGMEQVTDALLVACPQLKRIGKFGVGMDNIDLAACARHGVEVGRADGVNSHAVAELAVCFMMGLCRKVFLGSSRLRMGQWVKDGGRQLSGCTVGLVGLGHVGKEVAVLLKPWGCRILANDIIEISSYCSQHGIEAVDKETLFRTSDVVSLHVPLTPETRHLIDDTTLGLFQPGAYLVNTSRGGVVRLEALKRALSTRRLAGAALDVFETEPPDDSELLALPTLFGTAHIGGNSEEAVLAMGRAAIGHLRGFFRR